MAENTKMWLAVLERVRPTIQKMHFLTWFQNTELVSVENEKVTIGVPTSFALSWISSKYNLKLLQAFQEQDDSIKEVVYEVCTRLGEKGNDEGADVKGLLKVHEGKKVRKVRNVNEVTVTKGSSRGHVSSKMLNDKYLLNSFIAGMDNRLPHAAAQAVSDNPGGIYNPCMFMVELVWERLI